VLLSSLFLARGSGEAAPRELPQIVATAAWEFADLDGVARRIDWQARTSGGVLVFFFDLRSADSLLGLQFCDALVERAGDFGLTVVGVEATGRQPVEVRTELQAFTRLYRRPSFPVVADPRAATAKIFGNQRAPTTLLIGGRGEVVARRTVFDQGTAVELTRGVERLLQRGDGFFSPALRDVGVSEAEERELSARAAVADDDTVKIQALAWGDRLPAFDFTDTAGRTGQWSWPAGGVIRIAFFWSGASAGAAEDVAFFDDLRRRDGGEFLDIIAVESTGRAADVVRAQLGGSPARSIRVVADPQRYLVGLFGAGDPLPQTFLIGGRGEVLYRADGFGPGVRQTLEEKIARAGRLAGFGLPPAPEEVPRRADQTAGGGEAPSVSQRLERDKALRFNLSRGDYFFSNGQPRRALPHYERYLELEPGSLHALVRLAQSHDLLGDSVRARDYWKRVLAISPGHMEGQARLRTLGRTGAP